MGTQHLAKSHIHARQRVSDALVSRAAEIRHLSHHVGAQGCYLAVGASQNVLPGLLNLADEIFVGFFDFAHQGGSRGGKFSRNGAR